MTPNLPEDVQKPSQKLWPERLEDMYIPEGVEKAIIAEQNTCYPLPTGYIDPSKNTAGRDRWRFAHGAKFMYHHLSPRIEELEKENEALKSRLGKWADHDKESLEWHIALRDMEIQELKERKGAFDEEQDLEGYLQKYIGSMFGGLGAASIEHFLKTGTLNGTFRLQLTRLVYETHYQLNKGRESADAAEIQSLKEENARLKQESDVLKMLRNDEPTLKEMED